MSSHPDPEAQHSHNITECSQVEIVIFDSTAPVGESEGLYISASARAVADEQYDSVWAEAFRSTAGARRLTPEELLNNTDGLSPGSRSR